MEVSVMPLSPQDVARAIALIDDGRSLRYAARTIGAPYTTVQEAVKLFRETQSYSRRPGSGRKRITSGRDDRFLFSQLSTICFIHESINKEIFTFGIIINHPGSLISCSHDMMSGFSPLFLQEMFGAKCLTEDEVLDILYNDDSGDDLIPELDSNSDSESDNEAYRTDIYVKKFPTLAIQDVVNLTAECTSVSVSSINTAHNEILTQGREWITICTVKFIHIYLVEFGLLIISGANGRVAKHRKKMACKSTNATDRNQHICLLVDTVLKLGLLSVRLTSEESNLSLKRWNLLYRNL
ncbi:hypothetical protein C0J52_16838 [Blattella germanica]|nr:hypothetical protein C0J52_16838 [Blattella germanica]